MDKRGLGKAAWQVTCAAQAILHGRTMEPAPELERKRTYDQTMTYDSDKTDLKIRSWEIGTQRLCEP